MIHESRYAKAIDDNVGVIHGEQVGNFGIRVHAFTRFGAQAWARIFQNAGAFLDGSRGVNAGSMQ
jgi:hypothetical protein